MRLHMSEAEGERGVGHRKSELQTLLNNERGLKNLTH